MSAELASSFVARLAALRFADAFNPYHDLCDVHDAAHACAIRRANLQATLTAALDGGADSLWIARDLGHRGGRRTGLALTDEAHLSACAELWGTAALAPATCSGSPTEATAKAVWTAVRRLQRRICLWNVFPLHPHPPGQPLANRRHTRPERDAGAPFIDWLVQQLRPRLIVAIGKDASAALRRQGHACAAVRHPGHGGQAQFLRDIGRIYGCSLG